MAGKSRLTPAQVARMAEMKAKGYSTRAIATRYGMSERQASRLIKQWKEGNADDPMPV